MDWIKKINVDIGVTGWPAWSFCRISMGLAPISSIDYSKVKTITIAEFPNRAEYVFPMTTEFNQKLRICLSSKHVCNLPTAIWK